MAVLFVYGSLMCKEIVESIVGRIPSVIHNTTLPNYQRFSVANVSYPAIKYTEGSIVHGKILQGLTEKEIAKLDCYEGSEYNRVKVTVYTNQKQPIDCWTYEWTESPKKLKGDWDYSAYITTNNFTFHINNTDQPMFQIPLDALNGTVNVSIVYPGETQRDSKFPKLKTSPKSYFINMAIQANNYSEPNIRLAIEFYLITPSDKGSEISKSRFIDDQFTPGIFNVWQLKTLGNLYPSSMLWKPVVYLSEDRTIEQNTLMQVYLPISNNVTIDPSVDRGIFHSILPSPHVVSGFLVSLGQASDGFFAKTNYTFIQFTAGLDVLEPDSTKAFVTVALIISLALPGLVAIIAGIFIIKRRFSKQPTSSYNAIDD